MRFAFTPLLGEGFGTKKFHYPLGTTPSTYFPAVVVSRTAVMRSCVCQWHKLDLMLLCGAW